MNLSKEQLELISEAIDISEYNQFIIEETNVVEDKKKDFPRWMW